MTKLEQLSIHDNKFYGKIPAEIGSFKLLNKLKLENNLLIGEIPDSICSLNIDWNDDDFFSIYNNSLCPPYPYCLENYVSAQNILDCK